MDFFVSWYPGDLWIPDYDPESRLLISVTSVSQFWRLNRYEKLPEALIIDSGGFRYATHPEERIIPKDILTKQLKMLSSLNLITYLCTLDCPILDPTMSSNQKDHCITQTIAYAYEMKEYLGKLGISSTNIRPMGIIQGYDIDSLKFCAHEMKEIGFSWYGLGSLQAVKQNEKALLERVQCVIDQVGHNLHIFGISNVNTIRKLRALGIASFDSARPAKSAMYNQIFFYISGKLMIIESRDKARKKIYIPPELRDQRCGCPICIGKINQLITVVGKRQNIALRTIHNYWHLKMATLDA